MSWRRLLNYIWPKVSILTAADCNFIPLIAMRIYYSHCCCISHKGNLQFHSKKRPIL